MCTVTYLPNQEGFTFTTNRDEIPGRKSNTIKLEKRKFAKTVWYPVDPTHKGTWIAVSNNGSLACLINGAFTKHVKKPSYKRSRGIIPLNFFDFPSIYEFKRNFNFSELQPFTLISFQHEVGLHTLIWDGQSLHLNNFDSRENHIWSSVTLYTEKQRAERNLKFQNWMKGKIPTSDQIWDFHQEEGDEFEEGIKISRPSGIKTVSTIQVSYRNQSIDDQSLKRDSENMDLTIRQK